MFYKFLLIASLLLSVQRVKAESASKPPLLNASLIEGIAASGSAVIIGKNKNVYTFLTAGHVVEGVSSGESIFINPQGIGEELKVFGIEMPLQEEVDIAIGRFKYDGDLRLAVINDLWQSKFSSRCAFGSPYQKGASGPDRMCDDDVLLGEDSRNGVWNTGDSRVRIIGYSLPSVAIPSRIRRTITGSLLPDRVVGNKDGYELLYQASTTPGISGGPLYVDRSFCGGTYDGTALVGIHGRSEDYFSGGRSGTSLGIPIALVKDYLLARADEYGMPVQEHDLRVLVDLQYCNHIGKYYADADNNLFFYDNKTADYLTKQKFFKKFGQSPADVREFHKK